MSLTARPPPHFATHEVANQRPPLFPHDVFSDNKPLAEALEREGEGWAAEDAAELGREAGGDPMRWGREANDHPRRLVTHDRYGHRIDEVEFHPSYHALMAM